MEIVPQNMDNIMVTEKSLMKIAFKCSQQLDSTQLLGLDRVCLLQVRASHSHLHQTLDLCVGCGESH